MTVFVIVPGVGDEAKARYKLALNNYSGKQNSYKTSLKGESK